MLKCFVQLYVKTFDLQKDLKTCESKSCNQAKRWSKLERIVAA